MHFPFKLCAKDMLLLVTFLDISPCTWQFGNPPLPDSKPSVIKCLKVYNPEIMWSNTDLRLITRDRVWICNRAFWRNLWVIEITCHHCPQHHYSSYSSPPPLSLCPLIFWDSFSCYPNLACTSSFWWRWICQLDLPTFTFPVLVSQACAIMPSTTISFPLNGKCCVWLISVLNCVVFIIL